MTVDQLPRRPIALSGVLEDPGLVRRLVEGNGPYAPVQRYFANQAELDALTGEEVALALAVIAPNFRGDWAYDEPSIDGLEPILHHQGFIEASRALYGAAIVRPQQVYANITWRLPFHQGGGHTDIPAFRGIDRTRHPVTFLSLMGHSGLFEAERVHIATAVAWFYEGRDGGFEYWPDGPDRPSVVHEGTIDNTAMVGDNDFMYHRARAVGDPRDGMVQDMTLDSRLVHVGDGRFEVVDDGRTLAELGFDELRISISWKAMVFADETAARRYDDHTDDLTLGDALERIVADLAQRGHPVELAELGDDPTRAPALISAMRAAYLREPTA